VSASASTAPVEVVGEGSGSTTINGDTGERVFQLSGDSSIALRALRATGGNPDGGPGGGVASTVATLALDRVLINGNSITSSSSTGGGGVDIATGVATVTDSVISGNTVTGAAGFGGLVNGGGIRVGSTAAVTVNRTEIADNTLNGGSIHVARGGGIATANATGDMTITNSLIEGNQAIGDVATEGGGIFWDDQLPDNELRLQNVTFSGNAAKEGGAGQFANGEVKLAFVTIGPNTATSSGDGIRNDNVAADIEVRGTAFDTGGEDCAGTDPVSLGGNVEREAADCGLSQPSDVIATDPVFQALADYGGPTRTHRLDFDFRNTVPPAICLGADGAPLLRDQRNAFRPGVGTSASPNCDPGAYESNFCNTETVGLVGTEGDDTIAGTSGEDGILGMGGADTINPGAQDDDACGGDGNDVFQAHTSDSQNDLYFGDAGSDTVTLASFLDPSTIDLAAGTLTGAGLGAETLTSIENATGGLDPDTITGDAGPNVLDGFLDGDTITGGAGFDTLIGNTGDDDIFARDGGPDTVDCGLGSADTAQTDQPSLDTTVGCETIDALPEPPPANPATPTAKKKKCKKGRKLKKVKGKFKCVKKKRRKRK
jgi:hypothetical protein